MSRDEYAAIAGEQTVMIPSWQWYLPSEQKIIGWMSEGELRAFLLWVKITGGNNLTVFQQVAGFVQNYQAKTDALQT